MLQVPVTAVAVTVSVNVVVRPSGVPVTVIEEVPMGVEALVVIVNVLLQVGVGMQAVGLTVAVAPLGSPEPARVTACGMPETSVTVRVVAPVAPRATLISPELVRA